jgi:hypothetical protein
MSPQAALALQLAVIITAFIVVPVLLCRVPKPLRGWLGE